MSLDLFWLLVQASGWTLLISAVSIALGFLIGSAVCAAMLSDRRALAAFGRLWVSFFRGTPLLVQLLLIYYLLPGIGLDVPSIVAAIVGMTFCTSAYQAEILRGGFAGVPRGLVEAAEMCGFDRLAMFRRIRLPIAVRLTLPALVSEAIMIIKASSLVSVVGVIELTRMAQDLAASTFQPLELYASAGLIYLVVNAAMAMLGKAAERRTAWGRR